MTPLQRITTTKVHTKHMQQEEKKTSNIDETTKNKH